MEYEKRAERKWNQKKRVLSPIQIMIFGFVAAILLGTGLLLLPWATKAGESTSFLDALFTATSCVCVTGLMTVSPAAHWTFFGKMILLLLIQLGGIGVVAVSIGVMLMMGKKITLRERRMVQDVYGLDHLSGMVAFIRKVLLCTFLAEGIGILLLLPHFIPEYGWKGVGYAVFHGISAFCNAGIDILGEDSFSAYRTKPLFNLTILALVFMGSVGYVVWWDIKKVWKECREHSYARPLSRLNLHSKLVLSVTGMLIVVGMLAVLVFEWSNPDTLGGLTVPEKILAALFQSISGRTAGFYTIPQESLRDTTTLIVILFMLIGGSPVGTAGGMKTTTVGLVFLSVWSRIRGKKDTEAFGRRISPEAQSTALTIVMIFFMIILSALMCLLTLEDLSVSELLYETCSALGTAGLTRGITSVLSESGRYLLIVLMFCGRIGPITLAMALALRKNNSQNLRELPAGRVIIG